MEYLYLAKASGNKHYFERASKVNKALGAADLRQTGGMFPIGWDINTAEPDNRELCLDISLS